ncbi:hypothetical protein Ancab_036865 [Ancistrocladus abbreviatus]
MAKKREHRMASDSIRRRDQVESSNQKDQPADDSALPDQRNRRRLNALFISFFTVSSVISVMVYRSKLSPVSDPTLLPYVHERGLVKADVNSEEIVNENTKVSENMSYRHFTNPVLAYITPWNSGGYYIAKRFNSKFTHLSPVWYDLKGQGTKLVLEGRHNADLGWISELRMRGDAQVLPRVVLEVLPMDLLRKKKQRAKAIDLILTECKDMEYDGIVLESWSRWAAHGILYNSTMRNAALLFVKQLGEALHTVKSGENGDKFLQLIYVIGAPHSEKLQEHDFGPNDLVTLGEAVDGFSLMTYDFSSPYNPGPNAPLKWIRSTLQLVLGINGRSLAHKIFVGINFYGYDFLLAEGGAAQAVTGRDYLYLLKQHIPSIRWEKKSAEHYFLYTDNMQQQHAVFYPSLMSISTRLDEVHSWGAGISIWEIGQGLDYFFDLL